MNKLTFIGSVLGLALLVAALVYFNERDRNYLWEVKLRHDRYEPYDVGLYVDVLEESFGDDYEHILKSKQFELAADSGIGTMLYLDRGIGLTSDHIDLLLGFIERGNTAIFSSNIIPENLIERITDVDLDIEYSSLSPSENYALHNSGYENPLFSVAQDLEIELPDYEIDSLYYEDDEYSEGYDLFIQDTVIKAQFLEEPKHSYNFHFLQKDSLENYIWSGLPKPFLDEEDVSQKFTRLSILNDSVVDIISMNYGEGKLIVHMNPIFFSNIYFKEDFGYDYAEDIVSLFGEGKVYFNQHYTYLAWPKDGNNPLKDSDSPRESESPLVFILKHKGLKWALYSLFGLSIIYLLFSLKRQLPVTDHFKKPSNTSISYVKALSSFYAKAEDNTLLCGELMTDFKHFLRQRYHINTNLEKEELIPMISRYSGITPERITAIFDQEFKINFSSDSKSRGTVELYKKLEKFYQNCK